MKTTETKTEEEDEDIEDFEDDSDEDEDWEEVEGWCLSCVMWSVQTLGVCIITYQWCSLTPVVGADCTPEGCSLCLLKVFSSAEECVT